ncbi:MAG: glutamine--fructose-6-phosphate transaminase (isomerizing) [Acidobacteriota bacterium]|nr:glutamine--fructose-6-phosphate transaminase (isomerizing) [Acidobacteriota bacterium]
MCGIVGYVGAKPVVPVLVGGLRRLEYRGYDSAGIAVSSGGDLSVRRASGKLGNLAKVLDGDPPEGSYGIGHTRWATHGKPTEENAHPHRDCTGRIAVVHNGIIENYQKLKARLAGEGHKFVTETDTEVIAHLVESLLPGRTFQEAVRAALRELRGSYALAILSADEPDVLVAARYGPPIIVGEGEGEMFIASDVPAILDHTRRMYFLKDGEVAVLTPGGLSLQGLDGEAVPFELKEVAWSPEMAEKGGCPHFMLKEICEQPRALRETVAGRIILDPDDPSGASDAVTLAESGISDEALAQVEKIQIVACGTSWHAGLVGKFLIEDFARIPVEVDYGSEFRYRDPIVDCKTLVIAISQSGETADTLAAVREAKGRGAKVLSVCNVVGSMLSRESDGNLYTRSGPEIGVASTKAFTCQLAVLALVATYLGKARGTLPPADAGRVIRELDRLPGLVQGLVEKAGDCEAVAKKVYRRANALYLGRGIHYPIALEGALKLKEISYIHAEGYPAGEMKHGPNALIDKRLPVVALAAKDSRDPRSTLRYEKMVSNIQEARARDGIIVALATEGDGEIGDLSRHVIRIPETADALLPILEIVPLQLLAYHIAILRGCDVDQPRNLAKSVTVE